MKRRTVYGWLAAVAFAGMVLWEFMCAPTYCWLPPPTPFLNIPGAAVPCPGEPGALPGVDVIRSR